MVCYTFCIILTAIKRNYNLNVICKRHTKYESTQCMQFKNDIISNTEI